MTALITPDVFATAAAGHQINWGAVSAIIAGVVGLVLPPVGLLFQKAKKQAEKGTAHTRRIDEAINGITNADGKVLQAGVLTQLDHIRADVGGYADIANKITRLEGNIATILSAQQEGSLAAREQRGEVNAALRKVMHDVAQTRSAQIVLVHDTNLFRTTLAQQLHAAGINVRLDPVMLHDEIGLPIDEEP